MLQPLDILFNGVIPSSCTLKKMHLLPNIERLNNIKLFFDILFTQKETCAFHIYIELKTSIEHFPKIL